MLINEVQRGETMAKRVCVIGTGYVGSVTGAVLAELGHQVTCVDSNNEKIQQFANGPPFPLSEPGLPELIMKHRGKNLFFTTDLPGIISKSEVVFVCVSTPTKMEGIATGSFDMTYVDSVARSIAAHSRGDMVVVEKSTVPLRTAERIEEIFNSVSSPSQRGKFHVVSNPEFLAEGTAVKDALQPDRILVGTRPNDEYARKFMNELYSSFPSEVILHTMIWSSELAKLANNAFLSTKITQINAIASLCDCSGADVTEVSKAVGMDNRIGNKFLAAGIGWGGSCFGKDVRALIYLLRHFNLEAEARFYQAAHDLNYLLRERFVRRIHESLYSLPNKTVAVLGFAFKPNTDDIRDSPAIDIISMLAAEGANVRVVDPEAGHKVKQVYGDKPFAYNILVVESVAEAVDGADAMVLVTDWDEFKNLDFKAIAAKMKKPGWVFDGRNICTPSKVVVSGLNYYGVGRGVIRTQS
jgi:UDPglucose 6-dehydrogenase